MLGTLQRPIAIVGNDAGATNLIIAWLKNANLARVCACMAGPAMPLWKGAYPEIPLGNLTEVVTASRTLISGTGWASSLEHDARDIARRLGLKSIAVIDHWTDYRERFIRDGVEILPDEVWVSDEDARNLAEREFAPLRIVKLPNLYLANIIEDVRRHERSREPRIGKNLLYVAEPIRQAWGAGRTAGEFEGLEFFAQNIPLLRLGDNPTIRLRPHPSDSIGKYDQWIEAQKSLKISLSLDASPTLAESIAWSDVVIGCQTYAMVVALAAGRQVISSVPPWAPPCTLPQSGIVKLADLLTQELGSTEAAHLN